MLSQWETTLHCKDVSHWLSPYREWSLNMYVVLCGFPLLCFALVIPKCISGLMWIIYLYSFTRFFFVCFFNVDGVIVWLLQCLWSKPGYLSEGCHYNRVIFFLPNFLWSIPHTLPLRMKYEGFFCDSKLLIYVLLRAVLCAIWWDFFHAVSYVNGLVQERCNSSVLASMSV